LRRLKIPKKEEKDEKKEKNKRRVQTKNSPCILLASTITLRRIDMLAFTLHPEKLEREEPSEKKRLEPILEPGSGLAEFVGEEYELEFFILEEPV
jgi:hypothetical protein